MCILGSSLGMLKVHISLNAFQNFRLIWTHKRERNTRFMDDMQLRIANTADENKIMIKNN